MTGRLDNDVLLQTEGHTYRLVECPEPQATVDISSVPERVPYVMFAGYPDVMGREQAAEALDMNVKDLGELLMTGVIRAYSDGRRWRVPKVSLIEYVERRIERGCHDRGLGC